MTGRHPKVPTHPRAPLVYQDGDMLAARPVLWRIHRVRGTFLLPWNGFRGYGPLPSARYDPHPEPAGEHPGYGISYAAADVPTAVAEVFQTRRSVTASDGVQLTSWTPTRDLHLLDLSGDWALRNGAAHALTAAPRPVCRAWSRAIHASRDGLDGLWAPSTLTGRPIIALFSHAADSFPTSPAFSRPLTNDLVWELICTAAREIGYSINENLIGES